jgi:putative endopeptidase
MKFPHFKFLIAVLTLATNVFLAQKPGINLSYIDSSADPRNSFYGYCNGKWMKTFKLPESDARYGSFNEINENNLANIKLIYDAVSKNKSAPANSNLQRLRDFYNTALDSVRADSLSFTPLKPILDKITKVKNFDEFMALKADFETIGINLLFNTWVSPDLKNSRKHTFGITQAGYGLGDRDYYYAPQHEGIRTEYKKYISNLFSLIGVNSLMAQTHGEAIFGFEKRLVDKAFTRVQMRDPEKMYNIHTPKMIAELTPGIKWDQYFKKRGISFPDTINVGMVEYMKEMNALVSKEPIEFLKVYATAQLLMEAAPYLSQKFVYVNFVFKGMTMSGAKKMKPRWQRVHNVINAGMGEIISQEYVKKYFPAESKVKVNLLIDNLVAAYRERIASRTWMTDETKKQANRKLDLLIRKIGYPDKWRNYNGLVIGTDNYWDNVCRVNKFLTGDNLADLKKPVDRSKWQMTPVTVNAYYDPTTNEITFPAAILQPPFFDAAADDAANYGTMGSIIGHELTHGFDDQGAQFDADGNMKMWWTEKDYQNFKERTALIVKQFDQYVALDTLHVNGSMTQGENIADLGGLTMAYYAYKKSLKGKKSPVIAGFTGEQRFFIAWTQGWKSKTRDEELKRLLTVDYHAPAYFRAFAPLTNMKEFDAAFSVNPGDKMYIPNEKKIEIW